MGNQSISRGGATAKGKYSRTGDLYPNQGSYLFKGFICAPDLKVTRKKGLFIYIYYGSIGTGKMNSNYLYPKQG